MKTKTLPVPEAVRATTNVRDSNMEIRGGMECRALEKGEFEGYIAVWDTVDSYRSTFQRGAFKKTIKDRGDRIKVMYDHREVIGKVTEIREDDKGVFVRGRLSMDVEKARDTHALMLDTVIDTLSFGFSVVDQKYVDGVRTITEVKLFEVSPVVFEANDQAVVTSVRSDGQLEIEQAADPDEQRGEVADMVAARELHIKRRLMIESMVNLLDEAFYMQEDFDEFALTSEQHIDEFKDLYLAWAADFQSFYTESQARAMVANNQLSFATRQHFIAKELTPEKVAMDTSLSMQEVRDLLAGKPIANSDKLAELPMEIREAHHAVKREAVETLCKELRAGVSPAEKARITSLLGLGEADSESEIRGTLSFLRKIQTDLVEK